MSMMVLAIALRIGTRLVDACTNEDSFDSLDRHLRKVGSDGDVAGVRKLWVASRLLRDYGDTTSTVLHAINVTLVEISANYV